MNTLSFEQMENVEGGLTQNEACTGIGLVFSIGVGLALSPMAGAGVVVGSVLVAGVSYFCGSL